jgi:hypothetical protein
MGIVEFVKQEIDTSQITENNLSYLSQENSIHNMCE